MDQNTNEINPLGTERIEKLIVSFAVPSIIAIVVNSLYNMVDQIFIGQGIGYLGNAATNVVMPLTTMLTVSYTPLFGWQQFKIWPFLHRLINRSPVLPSL